MKFTACAFIFIHTNQIKPDMPVVCAVAGQFAIVDHMDRIIIYGIAVPKLHSPIVLVKTNNVAVRPFTLLLDMTP